ncbi:MAG: MBL fold metallo-hydrolase [Solobacterium sp.]|nr:MBL fold metallo-hydrolase [Solobacterium sp.]
MKRYLMWIPVLALAVLAACGKAENTDIEPKDEQASSETAAETEPAESSSPVSASQGELLYQGHASLRITTPENKVIYIDPYVPEGYDKPADLILITHDHYDHNNPELVHDRAENCRIITSADALSGGAHQTFDLGYVKVEAVEAGNNPNHDIRSCVGYVITLSDGVKIYVSGDTSTVDQMNDLKDEQIDYAFLCCDGQFNMDLEEAGACADRIQARHVIPYHVIVEDGVYFDRARAESFPAENLLVVDEGETIPLTKE